MAREGSMATFKYRSTNDVPMRLKEVGVQANRAWCFRGFYGEEGLCNLKVTQVLGMLKKLVDASLTLVLAYY